MMVGGREIKDEAVQVPDLSAADVALEVDS